MKALFVLLAAVLLIGTATLCPAATEFAIDAIEMPDEDCSAPRIASSDQGWTMISFTAEGVVAMSFITVQMIPTYPDPAEPWPPPVAVAQGSYARLCWSRDGFTLAIANGTLIHLLQADHDGDWSKAESYLMDAGGEVLSMDLWGVPTDAAGPAVFLTWNASPDPQNVAGNVYFASRSDSYGWSTPTQLTESYEWWPRPYPQVTWRLGPAGPLPMVFYIDAADEQISLKHRAYDIDQGWQPPVAVPGGNGAPTCFGGPFEVDTAYGLERHIFGLGPQPACPCGSIHHQLYTNGQWQDCANMTVDYGYYDWPLSPCLDLASNGTAHAFWYQLDSDPYLNPHRGYLEYRVREDGEWVDAGDFLDSQPSGPVQERVALAVSPDDAPILAWSRRDTIEGQPQPEEIWVARPRYASAVPEEDQEVPVATMALKAWPNPFNPMVRLSFEMEQEAPVRLAIFDNRGRHVTTLVDETLASGPHTRTSSGRDRFGRRVSSGVYFARMTTGELTAIRKIVLAK